MTALEPATKLTADNTRIVIDSPSNVPAALRQQYGMIEVPALVLFGIDAYGDGVDLTTDAFYRRFAEYEPQAPTTSQPPPGFFANAYRQAQEEGAQYVAAFTVTSRLSGTHASAVTATEEVDTDRIFVWDSDSMGSGWQAVAAARLIEQAVSVQELQIVEIGPAIASLIGPGTLGLAGHPVLMH